jgi:uncharacterized protein YndB with AHSA1/START domain
MLQFTATTTINAPVEKIWTKLSDVESFPSWESGVTKVEGTASLGSKLKLYSEVSPGRAFPLKVTEFEPNEKMTFASGMPLGLFKGARTYTLTGNGNGGVRFEMTEVYTGPLAPMITKSIPDLNPSFKKFADGLKRESEAN